MARNVFGGTLADWTFAAGDEVTIGSVTGTNAVVVSGVEVTFWNDETEGAQYTDLLDVDGNPISSVFSSDGSDGRAKGQIPPFQGPDGPLEMWAQAGTGPRALIVGRRIDADLSDAVISTDLTVAGSLTVGDGAASRSLDLESSFAGGEDDGQAGQFDSTSRLNLYSYQRADVGSYGETIRHYCMRKDSKQMEAWYFPRDGYDPATRAPVGPMKPVVWAGAHWEANNHLSNHKHWSVETPDTTGAIQTRFEVRFGNPNVDDAIAGLDKTLVMTNLADFVVRCTNGQEMRLSAPVGQEKAITFSHDYEGATVYRRWKLRATSEAETGSNAGTNFQLSRYDDTGTLIDSALTVTRSNGHFGLGTVTPGAKLTVKKTAGATADLFAVWDENNVVLMKVSSSGNVTTPALFFSGTTASVSVNGVAALRLDSSRNVGINNSSSYGGGQGVVGISNATVAPTGTPVGGGVLFVEGGALKWKGSSGTTTVIAPA